jgi:hypothetical protein
LFYETNGVSHESSGAVTVKINDRGSYSGTLYCAGVRYGLSGKFGSGGMATNIIKGKTTTLTVKLMVNLEVGASNLLGTVSGGTWTSDIYADPVPFNSKTNPAPAQGTYTVVFSPQGDDPVPPGSGYGTLKVDPAGKIKFTGSLADGTTVSQSSLLTSALEWPMYLPLYKGQGSALGWLAVASEVNSDVSGDVVWIKKPQKAKYYPGGFTNDLFAVGFKYTKPSSGQSPLGATTGTFTAQGDGLGSTYSSAVTISSNGKITGPGNSVKLSISPSTGILSGKFSPTGGAGSYTGRGIVLQRLDSVYGYFLGTSDAGSLTIVTP